MNGKGAKSDQAIARVANRQHGVVSIGQLRSLGISEDAVFGRARTGRLHRIHRGVYSVGYSALSDEARWMAAVLACGGRATYAAELAHERGVGPDEFAHGEIEPGRTRTVLDFWGAALSHRSAACLWGLLPVDEGPVDVSIASDSGRKRRSGIRLHRSQTLLPADVRLRGGIPVTSPARTIADLRRTVSKQDKRGLITPEELRRAIRQAGVLGLPVEDEIAPDRTRSDLERDFLRLCHRHRLPTPEVNVRIGRHLVDFLWRERGLVVETDGYHYHSGRVAFEDDRARDLELRGLGYQVVRLADRQLSEEPERIAAVLEACLARFPSNGPETRHAAP